VSPGPTRKSPEKASVIREREKSQSRFLPTRRESAIQRGMKSSAGTK
jgi:hypothetical protein